MPGVEGTTLAAGVLIWEEEEEEAITIRVSRHQAAHNWNTWTAWASGASELYPGTLQVWKAACLAKAWDSRMTDLLITGVPQDM